MTACSGRNYINAEVDGGIHRKNMHGDFISKLQLQVSDYEASLKGKDGLSEQTKRAYLSRIKGFSLYLKELEGRADFELMDESRALRDLAQDYHDRLFRQGAKASSVNASITAVYHFFAFSNYKVAPVVRDWVLKGAPRVLNAEEQDRLVLAIAAQPSVRDRALVSLLLYTGIRIGECRELKMQDVEISAHAGKILVSSRNRQRRVPLNTVSRQALLAWLIERTRKSEPGDDEPLFPNKHGEFMTRAAIDELLRKVGRSCGLNICAQVLRNTCLSTLLTRGSAPELVAEYSGQAKLEHVRRFTKIEDPSIGKELESVFESPWQTNNSFSLL